MFRSAAMLFVIATLLATACGQRIQAPVAINGTQTCQYCRQEVRDQRFAAELVAPGMEPIFFDDVGCLSAYLMRNSVMPRYAVAYVADHRTHEWITAGSAIYTTGARIETPAGSRVLAHASVESRNADPLALDGTAVSFSSLFPLAPPDGYR